jgi:hypothetical protein
MRNAIENFILYRGALEYIGTIFMEKVQYNREKLHKKCNRIRRNLRKNAIK